MHKKLIFSTLLLSSLSAPTIVFGMDNLNTKLNDKSEFHVGIVDSTNYVTWYNKNGDIAVCERLSTTTCSCEMRLEERKNSNILYIMQSKGSRLRFNLSLDLSNVNPKIIEIMTESINKKNQQLIVTHTPPHPTLILGSTTYMQQNS